MAADNDDCQLFVDPNNDGGLFDPQGPSTVEVPCSENVGSTLPALTPVIFCEKMMALSTEDYWTKLKILLGRYFATHGPNQLPDCIQECHLTELARMEATLRQGMKGQPGQSAGQTMQAARAIAISQYQQLSGEGNNTVNPIPPCGNIVIETLYKETYTKIVKLVATQTLTHAELEQLESVAALCPHEYGEVVTWARGLLTMYGRYDYVKQNCNREVEQRESYSEDEREMDMKHYPSPADEIVTVELSGAEHKHHTITIMDFWGRTVKQVELIGSETIEIGVSDLDSGYYFLSCKSEEEILMTKSLIIHHN